MSNLISRPYHPNMCCERCVFGTGEHADWCCFTTPCAICGRPVNIRTEMSCLRTMAPFVHFGCGRESQRHESQSTPIAMVAITSRGQ